MGLLKPAFAAEARWQAETFGDDAARAAAIKKLDEEAGSAPVAESGRLRPSGAAS